VTDARELATRVLAHVDAGVLLVDADGIVRLWNPAAEVVTGLSAKEVVGRPAAEAIPGWAALVRRVPAASGPGDIAQRTAAETLSLRGHEVELEVSAIGSPDGVVYTIRDAGAERSADVMRRELVAMVAHELKTPLASIHGAASTLLRAGGDFAGPARDRLLEIVAGEAARLRRLVNDLLAADALASGRLELAITECNAAAAVSEVVEAGRFRLPDGVSLEAALHGRAPGVAADPDRLRQVLVNLLDNAVQHSPVGETVRITVEAVEELVRFSVRDEGAGIPEHVRERVFEKFFRFVPDSERAPGGTGLGLYVSRELVARMGGRIWVDSSDGEGSTFIFELPAARLSE
jgi:PAS domain S-box-containing protein